MGAPPLRGPDDLDEEQRARMRHDVLSAVHHRPTTLRDRVYDVFALLGAPAPLAAKVLASAALVLGLATSATVASAEALPDQPLYPVKLATEEVRLALAVTPEDRASVHLSMAEHRLVEAEQLALSGLEPQAIVAGSTYGAELASAAAELASVESTDTAPALAELRQRLTEQQTLAAHVAQALAADPRAAGIAPVFRVVASIPPSPAPGVTLAETIAQHAADLTSQLAIVADSFAAGTSSGTPSTAAAGPRAVDTRPPATDGTRATARPSISAGPLAAGSTRASPALAAPASAPSGLHPGPATAAAGGALVGAAAPGISPDAAEEAARQARQEAEKAREAAKKAKEAAKRPSAPQKNGAKKARPRGRSDSKHPVQEIEHSED